MANSNLTPVKRVNKNGVAVIKHVRPEGTATPSKTMPAPSLGKPAAKAKAPKLTADEKRLAARIKALDRSRSRTIRRTDIPIYANSGLEHLFKKSYTVRGTDNEFYALLERFSPGDAVVLRHHGLQPNQVEQYINQYNYHYYVQDNSELVAKLRARGIPAVDFLRANALHYEHSDESMLDAAEVSAIYSANEHQGTFGIHDTMTRHIGAGHVSLDDLKAIGVDRCARSVGSYSPMLIRIHRGDTKATAQEIGDMLDRTGNHDTGRDLRGMIRARNAVRYGIEFAEGLKYPNIAFYTEEAADQMSTDDGMRFISYVDDVVTEEPEEVWIANSARNFEVEPYKMMWDAGISADSARDGLERGMTALQIIAVEKNGIATGISDGWI